MHLGKLDRVFSLLFGTGLLLWPLTFSFRSQALEMSAVILSFTGALGLIYIRVFRRA